MKKITLLLSITIAFLSISCSQYQVDKNIKNEPLV